VEASEGVAAARRGEALSPDRVLVESTPVGADEEGDPAGRLEVIAHAVGSHRLRVEAARATWLVVREPYYRNWAATIDGRSAAVRPAGGFFLAVRVEGGRHEVVLRYGEPRLLPGVVVAMVIAMMLLAVRGERPRVPGPT